MELSGFATKGWTISSSVLDVARCRLTVVSLVSEPSLNFPQGLAADWRKRFPAIQAIFFVMSPLRGSESEPLSSNTAIRFLHAYFGLFIQQRRAEHNFNAFLNPIFQTTLFESAPSMERITKKTVPRMFVPTLPWSRWIKLTHLVN